MTPTPRGASAGPRSCSREFPTDEIREVGYEAAVHGQKTYNGVAILATGNGLQDVQQGLPSDDDARVVSTVIAGLRVVNIYVVNGQRFGAPAYEHKLRWLGRLRQYVESVDRQV